MRIMTRGILAVTALALAAAGATVEACGGDSSPIGPGGDAGGDTSTGPETGGDTGAGDDAGEVTDGGANLDPDADLGGDDAGPDGAPCNGVANEAPAVASSCISLVPAPEGGAIVAGTYYLTAVAVIGSRKFCKDTFLPVGFRETMIVTVDSTGNATGEIAAQVAGGILRHSTVTFKPTPTNQTPAKTQSICPPKPDVGDVPYTSRVAVTGKQVLSVLLPYGLGFAIYRYDSK
jgi:hypothetical protein